VFAAIALLTKANAGCLALVPVPAALLARRADLLRKRAFWAPAAVVVLLAGPWNVWYLWLWRNITPVHPTAEIVRAYVWYTIALLGVPTVPFILAGAASGFFKSAPHTAPRALWASAVSFLASFTVFHCITPDGFEPRSLLMAAPWVALLFVIGAEWAARAFLPRHWSAATAALVCAAALYGATAFHVYRKPPLPYADVARDLIPRRDGPPAIFLVSSEATPETVMVAELAMRDRRPRDFVLRASKMLATMNWDGDRYVNKIKSTAQLRETLRSLGVSAVVIDTTPGRKHRTDVWTLRDFVNSDPDWKLTHRYQEVAGGPVVETYAFTGVVQMPRTIQVDVRYTLGRTLSAPVGAAR
jgi:hypothetical protein